MTYLFKLMHIFAIEEQSVASINCKKRRASFFSLKTYEFFESHRNGTVDFYAGFLHGSIACFSCVIKFYRIFKDSK